MYKKCTLFLYLLRYYSFQMIELCWGNLEIKTFQNISLMHWNSPFGTLKIVKLSVIKCKLRCCTSWQMPKQKNHTIKLSPILTQINLVVHSSSIKVQHVWRECASLIPSCCINFSWLIPYFATTCFWRSIITFQVNYVWFVINRSKVVINRIASTLIECESINLESLLDH